MFNLKKSDFNDVDKYVRENIMNDNAEYMKEKVKDDFFNILGTVRKPALFGIGFLAVKIYLEKHPISSFISNFSNTKMGQANPFNDPMFTQFTIGEYAVGKYMLTGLNVFIAGMIVKQVYSLFKKLLSNKMSSETIAVVEFIEGLVILTITVLAVFFILSWEVKI